MPVPPEIGYITHIRPHFSCKETAIATRANPGKYDCYQNAAPDEPLFTLLARDRHAPALVWLWSLLRELENEDAAVVAEARQNVLDMITYASAHGRQSLGLGQAVLAGVLGLIRAANLGVANAVNQPTDADAALRFLAGLSTQLTGGKPDDAGRLDTPA